MNTFPLSKQHGLVFMLHGAMTETKGKHDCLIVSLRRREGRHAEFHLNIFQFAGGGWMVEGGF